MAPDLAEFVSLVSESGANPFGLTSDRVMSEYRRWRNESYRFRVVTNIRGRSRCYITSASKCAELELSVR